MEKFLDTKSYPFRMGLDLYILRFRCRFWRSIDSLHAFERKRLLSSVTMIQNFFEIGMVSIILSDRIPFFEVVDVSEGWKHSLLAILMRGRIMRYGKIGNLLVGLAILFCLWGFKAAQVWGAESISSAVHPVDFDVLKRAQKDLQQDLGLPDHSDSGLVENPPHRNPSTSGLDDHPVLISILLFALGLGIILLGWVIRSEQKRESSTPREGPSFLNTDGSDSLEAEKFLPKKDLPDNRSRKKRRSLLSSTTSRSPGTFLSYMERLDSFLQTLQGNSAEPDLSCVALYHLKSNSAFHTLLSRSSGARFPRFFRPSLLSESTQNLLLTMKTGDLDPKQAAFGMTTITDGNIDSLCVLFFDQRGVSYLIYFSEIRNQHSGKWFRSVTQNRAELLSALELHLKDYSRFHYQIPEDTFDGYGVLDGRGFENRLFQELERADRLKTETLLFVFSVKDLKHQDGAIESDEEFMARFQRGVSLEIRNGDSITRAGDGHLFLLLPETLEADASIITSRLQKIFDSTKEELHRKDLVLGFREISLHGSEKEKLFEFLSTIE